MEPPVPSKSFQSPLIGSSLIEKSCLPRLPSRTEVLLSGFAYQEAPLPSAMFLDDLPQRHDPARDAELISTYHHRHDRRFGPSARTKAFYYLDRSGRWSAFTLPR